MQLATLDCSPQHGLTALPPHELHTLAAQLPHWHIEGSELVRTFHFANYHQSIAFVNALAWIANAQDHHPDLSVHYNRVVVRFSTHDADGLTLNDFICAARTDALGADRT